MDREQTLARIAELEAKYQFHLGDIYLKSLTETMSAEILAIDAAYKVDSTAWVNASFVQGFFNWFKKSPSEVRQEKMREIRHHESILKARYHDDFRVYNTLKKTLIEE
jgi:hypothetical protein